MGILELDTQLNELIIARQSKEAFLRFYAEDVVAQENDDPPRHGRDEWMQARLGMEGAIKRFSAKALANAAHGDTSFSQWEYDLDVEGMGAMRIAQVAVRRWRGDRVVHERFYHK